MKDGVTVYIMGKAYAVPAGLTIMQAMEYAGYQLVRGCGCRGGFCGACGTVYRLPDSYKVKVGLACQTPIVERMYLAQIPFYPANKARYDIEQARADAETVLALYPEVLRCVSCNSCTRVCPQDLKVMDYINAALRGDIAKVADLSFDCIMCGLCATRCPAEIVHYYVGLLCRRLYSRHQVKPATHLAVRRAEMAERKFEKDIENLMQAERTVLRDLYARREIEPGE